jgi:hypothetical protein
MGRIRQNAEGVEYLAQGNTLGKERELSYPERVVLDL